MFSDHTSVGRSYFQLVPQAHSSKYACLSLTPVLPDLTPEGTCVFHFLRECVNHVAHQVRHTKVVNNYANNNKQEPITVSDTAVKQKTSLSQSSRNTCVCVCVSVEMLKSIIRPTQFSIHLKLTCETVLDLCAGLCGT